eukprot:scaffold12428_cov140-Skeletonema_dohrnii-CCMP3373.AAC.4
MGSISDDESTPHRREDIGTVPFLCPVVPAFCRRRGKINSIHAMPMALLLRYEKVLPLGLCPSHTVIVSTFRCTYPDQITFTLPILTPTNMRRQSSINININTPLLPSGTFVSCSTDTASALALPPMSVAERIAALQIGGRERRDYESTAAAHNVSTLTAVRPPTTLTLKNNDAFDDRTSAFQNNVDVEEVSGQSAAWELSMTRKAAVDGDNIKSRPLLSNQAILIGSDVSVTALNLKPKRHGKDSILKDATNEMRIENKAKKSINLPTKTNSKKIKPPSHKSSKPEKKKYPYSNATPDISISFDSLPKKVLNEFSFKAKKTASFANKGMMKSSDGGGVGGDGDEKKETKAGDDLGDELKYISLQDVRPVEKPRVPDNGTIISVMTVTTTDNRGEGEELETILDDTFTLQNVEDGCFDTKKIITTSIRAMELSLGVLADKVAEGYDMFASELQENLRLRSEVGAIEI